MRWFTHLQHKPREVRQRYAFFTAVAITVMVTGVWGLSLPARFVPPSAVATEDGTRPFAGLWQKAKEQFGQTAQTAAVGETASGTDTIDLEALLAATTTATATTTPVAPVPPAVPVLIGTSSATGTKRGN